MRDILCGLRGLFRGRGEVRRLEASLKRFFGVRHCFLVSSGKAALTLILQALHSTGGVQRQAAKLMKVKPNTLNVMLKRLNIKV